MLQDTFRCDLGSDRSYKLATAVVTGEDDPLRRIGTGGRCRFCTRDNQTFRKRAHTFPECTGNKSIISADECDDCNALFGLYDSELALALKPALSFGRIRGKRGVPKLKGNGIKWEWRQGNCLFGHALDGGDGDAVVFNPITREMISRHMTPIDRFIPRYAYKALCKSAIALMPEAEVTHFSQLLRWLQTPDDTEAFHLLEVNIFLANIFHPLKVVGGSLLRRIDERDDIPYMLYIFTSGAVMFTINLMSDSKDINVGWCKPGRIVFDFKSVLDPPGVEPIEIPYRHTQTLNWAARERTETPLRVGELRI